jgi:hypothetical protein
LAAGSAADVVVYPENVDRQAMFESPRVVVRGGKPIWTSEMRGRESDRQTPQPLMHSAPKVTHTVRPHFDQRSVATFAAMHGECASFSLNHLWISDEEMATRIGSRPVVHPCRKPE